MKIKILQKELKDLIQRHKSAAHDRIIKQKSMMKHKQIENAVKYCIENRFNGYKAICKMKNTQSLLNVPTKEEDILSKWLAGVYRNKHRK